MNSSKGKTDDGRADAQGANRSSPSARAETTNEANAPDGLIVTGQPDDDAGDHAEFPVVGIGGSAGSLRPLRELLVAVGSEPGLAIVVVAHLDPKQPSQLSKILRSDLEMPVHEIEDGMKLEPNIVYVLPANAAVELTDGAFRLTGRAADGVPHPIDRFFRSIATHCGRKCAGVVLSGTLSDGTDGLRAIQASGGFTFVQDPETAEFRSMPESALETTRPDFILGPEQIGHEIGRLPTMRYITEPPGHALEDDGALEQVFRILRGRTGVDFTEYKRSTVLRRLHRRMTALRAPDLAAYAEALRASPDEADALRNELLIGVTRFFRDWDLVAPVRDDVLQAILRDHEENEPIRVWVAGCATGEEAYSLAITLREFLVAHDMNVPLQIFGTDVSEKAIQVARAGTYPEAIREDVPPEFLSRYFDKTEAGYRVNRSLRASCVFAVHDLGRDPPFSQIDMVSCRNVLIYMQPALQRRVLGALHYALKPNGYLLLGSSEAIGRYGDMFVPVRKSQRIFRKVGTHPAVMYAPRAQRVHVGADDGHPQRRETWTDADARRAAEKTLLERFAPPAVVVNANADVIEFLNDVTPYVMHATGPASLNLFRIAREGLGVELRSVLREARASGHPASRTHLVVKSPNGDVATDLEAIPLRAPGVSNEYILVVFQRRTEGEAVPRPTSPPADESAEVADLRRELAAAREYMQSIVEDYEATNEELRSANEEAMSSNEELQSTNEELETAKEELQSTNEELSTVNDELVARSDEIQTINDDVMNLLNSSSIPIIMLGHHLRIRRFTRAAQSEMNLIPSDVGRPWSDIAWPFDHAELEDAIRSVMETLQRRALHLRDKDGALWKVEVTPYRTSDDRIDGVVIVARRGGADKEED